MRRAIAISLFVLLGAAAPGCRTTPAQAPGDSALAARIGGEEMTVAELDAFDQGRSLRA